MKGCRQILSGASGLRLVLARLGVLSCEIKQRMGNSSDFFSARAPCKSMKVEGERVRGLQGHRYKVGLLHYLFFWHAEILSRFRRPLPLIRGSQLPSPLQSRSSVPVAVRNGSNPPLRAPNVRYQRYQAVDVLLTQPRSCGVGWHSSTPLRCGPRSDSLGLSARRAFPAIKNAAKAARLAKLNA